MTLDVLGARRVLARLRPDSEAARASVERLKTFRPGDEPAHAAEYERLRETQAWLRDTAREATVRDALADMPPLDPLVAKWRAGTTFDDPELFAAKRFLWAACTIGEAAEGLLGAWSVAPGTFERMAELMHALHPEQHPSRRFRLSAKLLPGLAEARSEAKDARRALDAARRNEEARVVGTCGGRFDIRGGWVAPDGKNPPGDAPLALVDGRWVLVSDELEDKRAAAEAAQEKVEELEAALRERLTRELGVARDELVALEDALVTFDRRLAVVRLADAIDGCWPETGSEFALEGGRDPQLVERLGDDVQPIDVRIGTGTTVVTGPNMGGKSALLRLVGLVQWLVQHALPVPAVAATVPLVDHLVYVGSEESGREGFAEGLSSFGREVRRVVEWREDITGRAFWLLDEFGRGTHPDDGAALAVDLVGTLASEGHTVLASTHFPALARATGATHLRIRGLVGAQNLEETLDHTRDALELRDALQHAMDYRPSEVEHDDVPRDARLVARALGLRLQTGRP